MAVAYFAKGGSDFSNTASWSDSTGPANAATLVCNEPPSGGEVQSGLSWSALTGINYWDFVGNWNGNVGGTGGSLVVDCDAANSGTTTGVTTGANIPISRIRWWGKGGNIYYTAGDDSTTDVCNFFQSWVGWAYLTGGDFTNLHFERSANLDFSSVATANSSARWFLGGGSHRIRSHASDALVTTICANGVTTIEREYGTVYIMPGATCILDCTSYVGTSVYLCGGTLKVINSGTLTNFYGWVGNLDLSDLARAWTTTNSEMTPWLTINKSNLWSPGTMTIVGSGPKGL